jgi:hypothetical protein
MMESQKDWTLAWGTTIALSLSQSEKIPFNRTDCHSLSDLTSKTNKKEPHH